MYDDTFLDLESIQLFQHLLNQVVLSVGDENFEAEAALATKAKEQILDYLIHFKP